MPSAELPSPRRGPRRAHRVLVVTGWYGTPVMPVAGVFVREHAELVRAQHDVAVVYPFQPGRPTRGLWDVTEATEDGIPTLRVRRRPLPGTSSDLAQTILGTRAALTRLRRSGFVPDVIHAHVFSAAAIARAAAPRTPMVVTEHSTDIADELLTGVPLRLARFAYRSADLVTPVSANLAERIAALGVRTPIRVVPNAVDTARFHPPQPAERADPPPERLLLVGALVPQKGIPLALHALELLRRERPTATLEIVGDGPGRAAYEALARELGVTHAVRFLGPLDRDGVAARMRTSHVLVSSSVCENLPGVLLEALASGLPIVGTDVGGVPDLVDRETGVLVPYGDAAALAHGIAEVLERRACYDPVRLARRAHERFGPARVAELWDAVYDELAGARG